LAKQLKEVKNYHAVGYKIDNIFIIVSVKKVMNRSHDQGRHAGRLG
jgi:hypothetical protein